GVLRLALAALPRREGTADALRAVRLPRPPRQEGAVPTPVDREDRRWRPAERTLLLAADPRAVEGGRRARPQDPRGPGGERPRGVRGDRADRQGRARGIAARSLRR